MNSNPYKYDFYIRAAMQFSQRIRPAKGRRFVISDIHGCLKTFKTLVDRLQLTNDDQLFLLGDYIDRGTDSKGVVDYILALKNDFQVFPIRGNHEEDVLHLIDVGNEDLIKRHINKYENKTNLFDSELELEDKYIDFIELLPYFIELDRVFLVHAGFDFTAENPFTETEGMIWIRDFDYHKGFMKGKTLIHGHTVTALSKIKQKIETKSKVIPLDNGCVFKEYDIYGNLLCLNIDTFELIIQENVEQV